MREIEVKVAYRFPNQSSFMLPMHSFNQVLRKWETMYEDGTVTTEPPVTPKTVAKLHLNLMETFPENIPKGDVRQGFSAKKRPFVRLKYIEQDQEHHIENNALRLQNMYKRTMHEFMMRHQNIEVLDLSGVNINTNMGASPLVVMIDETMLVRNAKDKNDVINKGRTLLEAIYKSDQEAFLDLAYACDIPNVREAGYSESLYNKMVAYVDNKPWDFERVYNSNQRSLLTMLNRALYTEVDGKTTAIEQRNGYYFFNNFSCAKIEGNDRQGLLNYFNANPEALRQLEQKMGMFIPRTELKKLPEPVEMRAPLIPDEDISNSLLKAKKTENKIRQEIYKVTYNMSLNKNLTTEKWGEYSNHIAAMKLEYPKHIRFIEEATDSLCKNFRLDNPLRASLIKEPIV